MGNIQIGIARRGFAGQLADVIHEARTLVGWSLRELEERSGIPRSTIWRLESGAASSLDLHAAERVLAALGIRATLDLDCRHLADRRRQSDFLHAVLNGYLARRVERHTFLTATEVMIGDSVPRGWIDLLGFREEDRALLVDETKSDIPDMGGLQRSLAFYEREAPIVARRLGWMPRRVIVLAVALDTEAVARRLADNRDLVTRAFPADPLATAAWIADPSQPAPRGWTLATADPASREARFLRPTTLGSRRRPPAYRDYADAAARLRDSRAIVPRGGHQRSLRA